MKEFIKYGTCCIVTAIVMLTAFYALNRGYQQMNGETADAVYSFFKPFSSLFGKGEKGKEKEKANAISSKPEQESQKKNDTRKEPKKEKSIVPKEFTTTESEQLKSKKEPQDKTESKKTETSSTLILIQPAKDERTFSKELERQIVIPSFEAVFIPTYSSQNLTAPTIERFQKNFPTLHPRDNTFVIEREIASSDEGKGYEISVYDKKGEKFLGTFETAQDTLFPFRGLPQFLKVGTNQFGSSSRFLIFSDISEAAREVLSSEEHFLTIFQNIYRPALEPGLLIGRDPKFGYEVYTLFPGIFIARDLR